MKQLPEGMQDHLNTGATTLCWCWRVTRTDGTVLGFTDHDRDLEFNNTIFRAATGFTASELNHSIGLSVDNMDIDGILNSDSLTETDLSSGLYDNATIELFRINWQDTSQRILMRTGSIGEVHRSQNSFTAEIRGLAHHLQQPKGRLYQYGCDANLGDSRCTINLDSPTYKATASVQNITDNRTFTTTGLETYTNDWFTRGILTWSTGPNQGRAHEVKFHTVLDDVVSIELWQSPAIEIEVSDSFEITAGCDRQFATCKSKFNNAINFRGCPHMPGNDFALSYPNRDDGNNDGGSLQ